MMRTGDYMGSSFGGSGQTWGPGSGFPGGARTFLSSERYAELDRKQAYFDCTQHDLKTYDFDGRMIPAGKGMWSQPLLTSDQVPWYVPLRARRPSHPYRLARVIVGAFTNMVFGAHRFPSFRSIDPATQDFAQAIVLETRLASLAIKARNIGGSVGTVGWSYGWHQGKPRVEVHNGKYLYVHSWEDRDKHIPRHVSKMFMFARDERDMSKGGVYVRNWYWFRQDWLPDADIVFHEVLVRPGEEPTWIPDPERSSIHGDHKTKFIWTQNLPNDESIDGDCDYDGLYENFDSIDLLLSVALRGTTLNLDPTLVLGMDIDQVNRMGVKKGSDNALVVGVGGTASYMEMNGSGITAGLGLFKEARANALEVAQCVVADPDKLAAAGISAVAMKAIYSSMTGKCDIYRDQYGSSGAGRVVSELVESGRTMNGRRVVLFTGDGEPYEAEQFIDLPPRIEKVPVIDEDGFQVGEHVVEIERDPGRGQLTPEWGPYFIPTPDDHQKAVTTASVAAGGKQTMSQQSAAEYVSNQFGRDPEEEWKRIQSEEKLASERRAAVVGGGDPGFMGGEVESLDELPPGAAPRGRRLPRE